MRSKKAKKLRRIAIAIGRDNPQLTDRIYKRLKATSKTMNQHGVSK